MSTVFASTAREVRARPLRGFTLVELIVAMAVIGTLMSLLLVGVQSVRETARRTHCANNLRNQVLGVQNFCATHQRYPAGRQLSPTSEYAWCVEILPNLEQESLAARFDRTKPWDAPANQDAAQTSLPIFRCPSALRKFPGKTDFGGIMGSILSQASITGIGLDNGILIEVGPGTGRASAVRLGEVTDGISNTIVIGECTDREPEGGGCWVSGLNCFSQDNGGVNANRGDDIFSFHPGGAFVGFADGRVQFISQHTAEYVLGAICTRSGGEAVNNY